MRGASTELEHETESMKIKKAENQHSDFNWDELPTKTPRQPMGRTLRTPKVNSAQCSSDISDLNGYWSIQSNFGIKRKI